MHFLSENNFKNIIETTLNTKVLKINQITTGWTNFVFIVKLKNKKNYVFRFPRNNFFARTLKKEKFVCKYLKNKLQVKIPNIKLYYFKGKPFTKHKYIKGKTLTETMSNLTQKEIQNLSKDIVNFTKSLQKINFSNNQLKYKRKTLNLNTLSNFLHGLSKNSVSDYNLKKHNFLIGLEKQKLKLSHGDFNPGNIILNKKNRMIAVLDFAFFTITSPYIDIARMIGRLPKQFENPLKQNYKKVFKTNLPSLYIDKLVKTWDYVEEKYIEYIKACHPDIVLPSNLQ